MHWDCCDSLVEHNLTATQKFKLQISCYYCIFRGQIKERPKPSRWREYTMFSTLEEFFALDNPHTLLQNPEYMQLLLELIQAVDDKEQGRLARHIASSGTDNEIEQLREAIQSLTSSVFCITVLSLIKIRLNMAQLKTPHDEKAYLVLLDTDLYAAHTAFAASFIAGKEKSIATNLAMTTPASALSTIAYNVSICFCGQPINQEVNAAFTLRREISDKLLGDHPEKFFTSREFNPGLYQTYKRLFNLIEGSEQQIADRIAQNTHIQGHAIILEKIQLILPGSDLATAVESTRSTKEAPVSLQNHSIHKSEDKKDDVPAPTTQPGPGHQQTTP